MTTKRDFTRQWRKFFWIAGLFVALVALLYMRFVFSRQPGGFAQNPVPVRAVAVAGEDIELFDTVVGRVEGERSVRVLSGAQGFVAEIKKRRGDTVDGGDVIVALEDSRRAFDLKEAGGLLASAKSELDEAQRKHGQYRRLFEKGVVSRDELDTARAALEGAESRTDALEASYEKARWYFDRLKVRSPAAGTVVEVIPDTGQEVAEGEVVARVSGGGTGRVVANVDSSVAKRARRGSKAVVEYRMNGETRTANATVTGVSTETGEGSTTYAVEVTVDGETPDGGPPPDGEPPRGAPPLWAGEFVNLRIRSGLLTGFTRVPVIAFLYDNRRPYVFVVSGGKAKRIDLGGGGVVRLDSETSAVSAARFPPGSLIVTEGNTRLSDGRTVKVVKGR